MFRMCFLFAQKGKYQLTNVKLHRHVECLEVECHHLTSGVPEHLGLVVI